MTTVLRRILVTAFIAILAGFGMFAALLGRRPRRPVAASAEVPVPIPSPPPVTPQARGGRGLAVGLVGLLLLLGSAGVVYENRDVLFGAGPDAGGDKGKPLAALPGTDGGTAGGQGRVSDVTTGSVQASRTEEPATVQPPRPPASAAPGFDVVRVEPNGDAVIAGRAAPNATVELLIDGKPLGSARANADGRFTFMPPMLPIGNSEIGLRATDAEGNAQRSPANVSVVVAPSRDAKPLIAVTSPDRPTMVLSQPDHPGTPRSGLDPTPSRQALRDDRDASAKRDASPQARDGSNAEPPPGANEGGSATTDARVGKGSQDPQDPSRPVAKDPVASANPSEAPRPAGGSAAASSIPKIVAIDAQGGGKLFVTARAPAGADLRLYLNDTLIAPATVGRDGTVTFAIGHGVRPGDYKVRLDLVDPATGKVRDRGEVSFTAPPAGRDEGVEYVAGSPAPSGTIPKGDTTHREPSVNPPQPSATGNQAASAPPGTGTGASPREPSANPVPPPATGNLAANVSPGTGRGTPDVYVAGIETARIERGDSLWRISRRAYGEGERYTLIYDANQDQIRDPDLIYPGQVFVLPNRGTSGADGEGRRD